MTKSFGKNCKFKDIFAKKLTFLEFTKISEEVGIKKVMKVSNLAQFLSNNKKGQQMEGKRGGSEIKTQTYFWLFTFYFLLFGFRFFSINIVKHEINTPQTYLWTSHVRGKKWMRKRPLDFFRFSVFAFFCYYIFLLLQYWSVRMKSRYFRPRLQHYSKIFVIVFFFYLPS